MARKTTKSDLSKPEPPKLFTLFGPKIANWGKLTPNYGMFASARQSLCIQRSIFAWVNILMSMLAKQVEDEMDELLLLEDDAFNIDPESLPRRLLTDFAIYNSEVSKLHHLSFNLGSS